MYNTTSKIKLPKLNLSKIKSSSSINSVERDFFLTSTDDIGFAQNQISQIDHNISTRKEHKMKLWERPSNNNIYLTSGRSNHSLLKEMQSKFLTEPKNLTNLNWKKQSYYLQTDVNSILDTVEISKLVKTKYEIKNKYKVRDTGLKSFIQNRKTMYIDSMLTEILKKEKNKINKKTKEYSDALLFEKENLNQDIQSFENYTMRIGDDIKNDEVKIVKLIQENKNLVEVYKRLSQEYNGTVNEIHKYLKLISNDKSYANFMHKIVGGDHEILHCGLNENINFINLKENELVKFLKNFFSKMKNTLNETDSDNKKKIFDKNNNIYQQNLDYIYKIKEENILNLIKEKQRYMDGIAYILKNKEENRKDYQIKYNMSQEKLLSILDEIDKEQKKMNLIFIDQNNQKYNHFIEELLIELNTFIFNKGKKKKIEDISIIGGVIIPIMKEIGNMESKINDLSNLMNSLDNEDNELFRKIVAKVKTENRAKKLIEERRLIEFNQMLKKQNIMNKINKIIYKGRNNFKNASESKLKKNRVKKKKKVDEDKIDMDMLYYE